MADLLPSLQQAITELHVPRADHVEAPSHDFEARFELFSRMYKKFGERDGYTADFDVNKRGRRLSGSLADDLTDIYFDLKRGLDLLSRFPDQPNIAINDWQRSFHLHWRHHLSSAQRQLNAIRARKS
jgi:hypothetical protein